MRHWRVRAGIWRRWADLSLRAKTLLVVAIPTAALLLAVASFWASQRFEQRAADQIAHTLDVKARIEEVKGRVVDAESAVRGYLLTGNTDWLDPYVGARAALMSELEALATLTADDPAQVSRIQSLVRLISQRLVILDEVRAAGTLVVGSDALRAQLEAGYVTTQQTRELLAAMDADEERHLAERRVVLDGARSRVTFIVGGILGVGALGALAATLLLTSGVVRRLRHVQMNAIRLAAGEPIDNLPPARDEVGQVAVALSDARELLVDRERSLEEARQYLEHLIETGPVLMIRVTLPDGDTEYVSPNVRTILGFDPEAIRDTKWWWRDHIHPDDLARVEAHLQAAHDQRAPSWGADWRFIRSDGAALWVEAAIVPEYDESGAGKSAVAYCLDVTSRKVAEAARDETEHQLRTTVAELDDLYNRAPCGYHSIDENGIFLRMNDTELGWLGYTREEVVGKLGFLDLLTPEGVATYAANFATLRQQGWVADLDFELRRKDGSVLPVTLNATAAYGADGRFLMSRSTLVDATTRREVERAQEATRAAAESANRATSEFVSRMSHELRTPLHAILGFSQLLELDELPQEQAENVRYISRAGRHLLELINQVLDISRIESGTIGISPEPVEIGELLTEVVAIVGTLADQRRIRIETDPAGCDCFVVADRQRLRQVLLNLLSNAVKYNRDDGSIAIRCEPQDGGKLRVAVSDTGYGISPKYVDRLFRPFDRLGAEGGEVEGTGMGLALSKRLVESMGGTMGAESTLDVGSTFWVDLQLTEGQLARFARTQTAPVDPGDGSRGTVLQIDDNASSIRLVEQILARRDGKQLIAAMQGRLGIELARQHRPDVILLDVHLPDVKGIDVLHELKTHPETREVPVIVLSAASAKNEPARFLAAGAAGYLTKPLDVAEFLRTLDAAIAEGESR